MQENLEELSFAQMHVGPVFALAQIQESISEEFILKYVFAPSQICIREGTLYGYSGCIHTPLISIHKNVLGELIERVQKIFLGN